MFVPTVFIVDDDPSVRTAVRRLLASVGLPSESFETATDFLKRAESGITGCLVLDVRMPGPSGLDLQRALNAAGQDIPIIFVTAHADVPLTVRAMKAGALEVLTKPFDDQALLDAVYQALEKERVRRHDRQELHKLREHFDMLTGREREVMAWAARGKTVADTAQILGISPETVEGFIKQALRKLGASNKTHGVAKSIALGIIDL